MALFQIKSIPLQIFFEKEADRLRMGHLIEERGGVVVLQPHALTKHFIDPATDYCIKRVYPLYSIQFIEDSIGFQALQPLANYELTQWSRKKKVHFTKADEEALQGYARAHPGLQESPVYWQGALDAGFILAFNANELCSRWITITNRHSSSLKTALKRKNYSFLAKSVDLIERKHGNPLPTSVTNKKCKLSATSTQQITEYQPTFIICGPEGREVLDLAGLEWKAKDSNILEVFLKLVQLCRKQGQEQEVLHTLIEFNGDIRSVLAYYQQLPINN